MLASDLLTECEDLFSNGLITSAELILSLFISNLKSESPGTDGKRHAPVLCQAEYLIGKCYTSMNEHGRAITHFRRALQCLNDGSDATLDRKGVASRIKEWEGKACVAANDLQSAREVLESIHESDRNVEVWRMLASLYVGFGQKRHAVACYKKILSICPNAVEAYVALVKLDVPLDVFPPHYRPKQHAPWLNSYLQAVSGQHHGRYAEAKKGYKSIEARFPETPHIMSKTAICASHLGDYEEAFEIFEKLRKVEPEILQGMDTYSEALKSKLQRPALTSLSESLIQLSPQTPEPWLSYSSLMELKKDYEKAMVFAEKAISINPMMEGAYRAKAVGHYQDAASSFRKAYRIEKGYETFKGLMESYIGMERMKEAVIVAKEAVEFFPNDARAITLIGTALSYVPNAREKARQAVLKALQISPHCVEAILALVSILDGDQNWEESIKILEREIRYVSDPNLHLRLADIYVLMDDFEKAISHYNTCMTLDPGCEKAREGIERVERIIGSVEEDMEDDENNPEM